MKTRDAEALAYVLESGLWKIDYETGDILTRRDRRGKDTDPPIWRSATFLNPSKKSSTRKRLWVNGRRVYANRVAWVLHNQKPIPEGFQIDHDDNDSLNDRPYNLVLMDAEGNRVKELANGRVQRFQRCQSRTETSTVYAPPDFPDYIGPAETTAILRPDQVWEVNPGRPQKPADANPLDWRISLTKDIKQVWKKLLARLRSIF